MKDNLGNDVPKLYSIEHLWMFKDILTVELVNRVLDADWYLIENGGVKVLAANAKQLEPICDLDTGPIKKLFIDAPVGTVTVVNDKYWNKTKGFYTL